MSSFKLFLTFYFILDSTNLYGKIQCQPLPTRSYGFLDEKKLQLFELFFKTRAGNFKKGQTCVTYKEFFNKYFEEDLNPKLDETKEEQLSFLVEADIMIDSKFHEYLKDFAVPAEKYQIADDALSEKSKLYKKEQNYGKESNVTSTPSPSSPSKLCLSLLPKFHFKTTLENLLLLTELGYEVTRVHNVLRAVSSPFLRRWVFHNTLKRNEAKKNGNLYLDMFYKLVVCTFIKDIFLDLDVKV